jgi:spermidine/putrescine transport system ATP-binding protein
MAFDLECREVVKTFGAFTAVDRVSLQIPAGTFFSILGPSGCGKTTLLRMIAGFGRPSAGDILIQGRSVLDTPPNKRAVNMVFQHLALFPTMTVAENIAYGLRRRRVARAEIRRRVDDVLARIGLPDAGGRRIDQLSGGQKQRVAIARCMVLEPAVLLLDEPLGALDLKLREHMKVELKQLQHQFGTTFVYITHDQSEALVMSDRVAVMNAGRFEQVGTPQELYYEPQTAFVAGFVGDSNRWAGRVARRDARRLEVECDGGMVVVCTAASDLPVGARVEAFVRPESVAVRRADEAARPGDGAQNELRGVLTDLLFNGASSRALVRTERGEVIAVALPQDGGARGLSEGAALTLGFAAEHCLCFPLPAASP